MGMGLRGRRGGRRRAGARRRNRRRRLGRRRRRHGGGGGLGRLLCMCFGGAQEDPMESNREDIYELHQAQQLMLISLNQQGTMINTSSHISQPSGFQTVPAWGPAPDYHTVMATQQPSFAAAQQYSSVAAAQQYSSVAATQYSSMGAQQYPSVVSTQYPMASSSTVAPGPSSGFSASSTVMPLGPVGAAAINEHQTKQLQFLTEIQAQLNEKNDADTHNVLCSQYNQIVEQMKVMESVGYSYPGGVPPNLVVVDNQQHAPGTGTGTEMSMT